MSEFVHIVLTRESVTDGEYEFVQERLAKIYGPDRAEAIMEGFFNDEGRWKVRAKVTTKIVLTIDQQDDPALEGGE